MTKPARAHGCRFEQPSAIIPSAARDPGLDRRHLMKHGIPHRFASRNDSAPGVPTRCPPRRARLQSAHDPRGARSRGDETRSRVAGRAPAPSGREPRRLPAECTGTGGGYSSHPDRGAEGARVAAGGPSAQPRASRAADPDRAAGPAAGCTAEPGSSSSRRRGRVRKAALPRFEETRREARETKAEPRTHVEVQAEIEASPHREEARRVASEGKAGDETHQGRQSAREVSPREAAPLV